MSSVVKTVAYVDNGENYKRYFEQVFPLVYTPRKVLSTTHNASSADIVLYSFEGEGNKYAQARKHKIMVCGEPNAVTSTRMDLLLDCKIGSSARVRRAYLPFYVVSFAERYKNHPKDLLKGANYADRVAPTKSKFCAFMYRAIWRHREALYDAVNTYKRVDALGRSKNPSGGKDRSHYRPGVSTYMDLAVEKYKPYKFVICCENTLKLRGYVTEKIVNAMLAGAIPIYYGAPDIVSHFNPASFINVESFPTVRDAVLEIKRIDTDAEAYSAMLSEPWLKGNALSAYFDPEYLVRAIREMLTTAPRAAQGSKPRRRRLRRVLPRVLPRSSQTSKKAVRVRRRRRVPG